MKYVIKFSACIFLKYLVLYAYLFIRIIDFDLSRVKTPEDFFYTLWMLLFLPLVEILVLILPFRFALNQHGIVLIISLTLFWVLEFLLGWTMTSQSLESWMGIKIVLSILLLFLFYGKQIKGTK